MSRLAFNPVKMLIFGVSFSLLSACQSENTSKPSESAKATASTAQVPVAEMKNTTAPSEANKLLSADTLVTVNQSTITQAQLDYASAKAFGQTPLLAMDPTLNKKLLDSLVSSRAMALLAEQAMREDERAEMEQTLAAYRESLLVKRYIRQQVAPASISEAQIKAYYDKHQTRYGASVVKRYEWIVMDLLSGEQRAMQLNALQRLKTAKNWDETLVQIKAELKAQGLSVTHQRGESRSESLAEPMKQLLSRTAAGETSSLHTQHNQARMLKVLSERQVAAKPFSQVVGLIRKQLSAAQLKRDIKALTETVKSNVTITYIKG